MGLYDNKRQSFSKYMHGDEYDPYKPNDFDKLMIVHKKKKEEKKTKRLKSIQSRMISREQQDIQINIDRNETINKSSTIELNISGEEAYQKRTKITFKPTLE